MRAADIKIEWDEDGCHLIIDGDSPDPEYQAAILDYVVEDPEQLYDRVKAAILPWLMERDEALREYNARLALSLDASRDAADMLRSGEAYDRSDPKHPDWHSIHADIWDARAGK